MQLSLPIELAPPGFTYVAELLTPVEEQALVAQLQTVELKAVVMHGQAARRTVAHFGVGYGYDSRRATEAPPLPPWLQSLAARVAPYMHARPEALAEVLVTYYPPGARIGWHRDAPMFGPAVAGVSLLGACRLRLRRPRGDAYETHETTLAPRSLYILDGAARAGWQHMIPALAEPRWSITFRTLMRADRMPSRSVSRRRGDG